MAGRSFRDRLLDLASEHEALQKSFDDLQTECEALRARVASDKHLATQNEQLKAEIATLQAFLSTGALIGRDLLAPEASPSPWPRRQDHRPPSTRKVDDLPLALRARPADDDRSDGGPQACDRAAAAALGGHEEDGDGGSSSDSSSASSSWSSSSSGSSDRGGKQDGGRRRPRRRAEGDRSRQWSPGPAFFSMATPASMPATTSPPRPLESPGTQGTQAFQVFLQRVAERGRVALEEATPPELLGGLPGVEEEEVEGVVRRLFH